MFDCNSFINRKGWKQRELAERLGVGTSTVGMWCTGKSTPPYDVILKLIDLGISSVELLGEELSSKLIKNSTLIKDQNPSQSKLPIDYNDPKFQEVVEKALLDIEQRKQRGIIK